MRAITLSAFAMLAFTGLAHAQETATCKDGTAWSGARRGGACRGHQGVQAFGATAGTPATAAAGLTAPAASAAPTPAAPASPVGATPAAPGGGAGQVWVNSSSKVYHCPGDRYYGKTKHGSYMTEAAAKSAGDHPDHGKACS